MVCPAVSDDMSNFLLGPEALFKLKLAKFDAPTEAIAAKLTVKKCTDQIALDNRLRITKILVIIFFFASVNEIF